MNAPHLAARASAEATGAIEAQLVIVEIAADHAEPELAWLRFIEVATEAGWRTPQCRAFIVELAKRASRAAGA